MKLKIVPQKEKITNQWTIEKVATEYPPQSWENVFENAKHEIKDISDILQEDERNFGEIMPNKCDIFKAFWNTNLTSVKVVIFGQDPYPNKLPDGRPQATGMAFSVPRASPIPSSLKNIFKELSSSVEGFQYSNHGDLTNWSIQGVLMLNSCLTVRENSPGSHKEIWNGFIKKVINAILEVNPSCIFVAWGKHAQNITSKFVGERATVLESSHPSGLSSYRGFIGCKHFSEINSILTSKGFKPIDWNLY